MLIKLKDTLDQLNGFSTTLGGTWKMNNTNPTIIEVDGVSNVFNFNAIISPADNPEVLVNTSTRLKYEVTNGTCTDSSILTIKPTNKTLSITSSTVGSSSVIVNTSNLTFSNASNAEYLDANGIAFSSDVAKYSFDLNVVGGSSITETGIASLARYITFELDMLPYAGATLTQFTLVDASGNVRNVTANIPSPVFPITAANIDAFRTWFSMNSILLGTLSIDNPPGESTTHVTPTDLTVFRRCYKNAHLPVGSTLINPPFAHIYINPTDPNKLVFESHKPSYYQTLPNVNAVNGVTYLLINNDTPFGMVFSNSTGVSATSTDGGSVISFADPDLLINQTSCNSTIGYTLSPNYLPINYNNDSWTTPTLTTSALPAACGSPKLVASLTNSITPEYQWYTGNDCLNALTSQITSTLFPISSGDYSVSAYEDGCTFCKNITV